MKELEIEFKNLLKEDEYKELNDAFFNRANVTVQKNFYIDTKDLELRAHKMLLRVRVIDGAQVMTLKMPTERGVLEFHGELNIGIEEGTYIHADVIPNIILEEFKLREISIQDVYVHGALETKRQEVEYKDGLLVLDESTYLGQKDFELEYEVSDYDLGETHFLNLLEAFNIERVEEVTKSERFYKRLSEVKKEQ